MTPTDPDSNTVSAPADLVFREAWEDERLRAMRLFPEAAGARWRCFVAVRQRPVERIVGAAFWREAPGPDQRLTAEFRWRMLPALAAVRYRRRLLSALAA